MVINTPYYGMDTGKASIGKMPASGGADLGLTYRIADVLGTLKRNHAMPYSGIRADADSTRGAVYGRIMRKAFSPDAERELVKIIKENASPGEESRVMRATGDMRLFPQYSSPVSTNANQYLRTGLNAHDENRPYSYGNYGKRYPESRKQNKSVANQGVYDNKPSADFLKELMDRYRKVKYDTAPTSDNIHSGRESIDLAVEGTNAYNRNSTRYNVIPDVAYKSSTRVKPYSVHKSPETRVQAIRANEKSIDSLLM